MKIFFQYPSKYKWRANGATLFSCIYFEILDSKCVENQPNGTSYLK